MEQQQQRLFKIIGITSARALEVYEIEPIATFLNHQCVNVVERILKYPTHPITQKQLKFTIIQEFHNTSQQLQEQKHSLTSSLPKALLIKNWF
jgi:hypothetical protein